MKFKSLFRRGHGSPSSSGTKHRGDRNGSHIGTSAVPNNNEAPMRPAASVSSLDSKYHKISPMLKQPAKNAKSFEAEDSDQSRGMDIEAIKREMEIMAQDKANLEAKVQELIRCHGELEKLRLEVTKLKVSDQYKILMALCICPLPAYKWSCYLGNWDFLVV